MKTPTSHEYAGPQRTGCSGNPICTSTYLHGDPSSTSYQQLCDNNEYCTSYSICDRGTKGDVTCNLWDNKSCGAPTTIPEDCNNYGAHVLFYTKNKLLFNNLFFAFNKCIKIN